MTIPADLNPADNDFYFAFERPLARRRGDRGRRQSGRPTTATGRVDLPGTRRSNARSSAYVPEQLTASSGKSFALLLRRVRCPRAMSPDRSRFRRARGGYAIFMPPKDADDQELLGHRWTPGSEQGGYPNSFRNWSRIGAATRTSCLPTRKAERLCRSVNCRFAATAASRARGRRWRLFAAAHRCSSAVRNRPMRLRVVCAYLLATTPALGDSSLATNGVVLYVLVQRALAGRRARPWHNCGNSRRESASPMRPGLWQRLLARTRQLSTEYPFIAACTRRTSGCWPSIVPLPKTRHACLRMARWPAYSAGSISFASTIRRAAWGF